MTDTPKPRREKRESEWAKRQRERQERIAENRRKRGHPERFTLHGPKRIGDPKDPSWCMEEVVPPMEWDEEKQVVEAAAYDELQRENERLRRVIGEIDKRDEAILAERDELQRERDAAVERAERAETKLAAEVLRRGNGPMPVVRAQAQDWLIERVATALRPLGYAVGVHGSRERDLDLIAVPWVEDAEADIEKITDALKGAGFDELGRGTVTAPHGRLGFALHGVPAAAGVKYVDLSLMLPCGASRG